MRDHDGYTPAVCPVCGKAFHIASPEDWVYKRESLRRDGKSSKTDYLDRYSCLRKYDAEREENIKRWRSEKARQTNAKKRVTFNPDIEGRECETCKYLFKGKYGFYDCSIYGFSVNPFKTACKMYKAKEEFI